MRIDRTGRATAFSDRGPRPDRQFGERNEGYRDNRSNRDGRPREFRPYREPSSQPTREMAGEGMAATALPSFITGEPKSGGAEANGSPVPEQVVTPAAPAPENVSETGTELAEAAPGDVMFQGRTRRRRLRSPYGYSARQAADEEIRSRRARRSTMKHLLANNDSDRAASANAFTVQVLSSVAGSGAPLKNFSRHSANNGSLGAAFANSVSEERNFISSTGPKISPAVLPSIASVSRTHSLKRGPRIGWAR